MLLDRKKINRLTRWAAIILAIVFLLSFVLLGVGSSSAGNVFSGCDGSNEITSQSSFQDREEYYMEQLQLNPQDDVVMLQLAALYGDDSIARYQDAINWFNKYLELNPEDVDTRLRIASIYIFDLGEAQSAVAVLTEATQLEPDNADAFLQLGLAQRESGQNQAAILSLSRYLELSPGSANADDIRKEIETLSTLPAVEEPPAETVPGAGDVQIPVTPVP